MIGYKILVNLFIFIVIVSCSKVNISTNQTDKEQFYIRNGYFNGQKKEAELKFERYTWNKELALIYDLRISPLSQHSEFFKWLSLPSQNDVRSCEEFYIMISYAFDSRFLSHRKVSTLLSRQGGEEVLIPDFSQAFRLHPVYEKDNLQRHLVRGLCFKRPRSHSVKLELPGFKTVTVIE